MTCKSCIVILLKYVHNIDLDWLELIVHGILLHCSLFMNVVIVCSQLNPYSIIGTIAHHVDII